MTRVKARWLAAVALSVAVLGGCAVDRTGTRPPSQDAPRSDAGIGEAAPRDGGARPDAFGMDTGPMHVDAGSDAASPEASTDAPPRDEECNGTDDDRDDAIDEGACDGCERRTRGDFTYLYCPMRRSWLAARDDCRARGYELVTVTSGAHDGWVTDTALGIRERDWWIGLNDREREGVFVWTDGAGSDYRNWGSGEPNDYGGEDCVGFYDGNPGWEERGKWNDFDCRGGRPFICRR